ncbi:hypothetical protein KsCSTR_13340 [Candidatus Kuenenia stuttgartiensis]|uniref:Uncharacterized protein n=1 Tax=Kuenenia stuttgartiensis TaxID=174633 RepID=Q1Q111_KUEST|nr:hypothetical protein KsCSTR_13340 [Candidatus Kuenenia stuttgartiensis]CAJ73683.1 unknown protein [Candidatus Kuenenia stuttgartiensis]
MLHSVVSFFIVRLMELPRKNAFFVRFLFTCPVCFVFEILSDAALLRYVNIYQ